MMACVDTGPISDAWVSELDALKQRLAAMGIPDESPGRWADEMGMQISAIRLDLRRFALDRKDLATEPEVRSPSPDSSP